MHYWIRQKDIMNLNRWTITLIFILFLSNLMGQREIIQSFEEYPENKNLTNWTFSYTKFSRSKGKKVVKKFDEKIEKEGILIETNDSGEQELVISRIGPSIHLETTFLEKLNRNDLIQISFDFKFDHLNALKAFWISHELEFEGNYAVKTMNQVFKAYESMIDTITPKKWHTIKFTYAAPSVKGTNDHLILNYLNPYGGQTAEIRLKNFKVVRVETEKSKNLIPNPSFEYLHYFPMEYGAFGNGLFAYWNDFGHEYDIAISENEGIDIYVNQVPDISYLSLVASEYFSFYSDSIQMYDGHFCAVLSNEYKWEKRGEKISDQCYLQVRLKQKLIAGKSYNLRFAYMLCPNATTACNAFGVKFSSQRYNPNMEVDFKDVKKHLPDPDIKVFEEPWTNDSTWTVFETEYVAKGGEQYLTIGVFDRDPIKTVFVPWNKGRRWSSDYLIDCVSLTEE